MRRNQSPVQITINHNPTGEYAKIPEEQAKRAKIRSRLERIREDRELEASTKEVWEE